MLLVEYRKTENLKPFLPKKFKRDRQIDVDFWRKFANGKCDSSINLPYFVQSFRENVLNDKERA